MRKLWKVVLRGQEQALGFRLQNLFRENLPEQSERLDFRGKVLRGNRAECLTCSCKRPYSIYPIYVVDRRKKAGQVAYDKRPVPLRLTKPKVKVEAPYLL